MASYQYIYVMKGLNKTFPGGKQVLKDIWLSFLPGAKIGVLGLNGSGKSTLLKIMAGQDDSFTGEAWAAEGVRVGFLEQEPRLDETKDVLGNVMDGAGEMARMLARFEEVSNAFSDPDADMDKLIAEQAELQEKIDAGNGWDLGRTVEIAMDALRCPPSDARVDVLSGGERRRVALCRLLLQQPDLLLLDEPTNHLDAESVAWLEHHLQAYEGTVIAITHDRYFLDNVAGWILELDRNGKYYPFEGNYSGWLEQKRERLRQEEKQASARQRTLERELEWVRMSPRARQAKPKARLQNYEALLAEQQAAKDGDVEISIPVTKRLGNLVVEGKGVAKAYGDKLLFDDFDFELPPGAVVGVIGPNGAGKTTLMRMIVGEEQPDGGSLRVGDSVELAYVDQGRDDLDPEKTVWDEISGGQERLKIGNREVNSRAYVAGFNFRGPDQQKKVGDLSGGERNRVHLAKLLRRGGNVLLLDEPTNDLDVDTLRSLEEAVLAFPGCAVVVSHDRWFLDRIATHIIAFEGDSRVVFHHGNYESYEEDRVKRLGAEAVSPKRIKYRPLVRS